MQALAFYPVEIMHLTLLFKDLVNPTELSSDSLYGISLERRIRQILNLTYDLSNLYEGR